MSKSFDEKFLLQTNQCSPYDVTSICSCDVELASEPTDAILHQQSRFWIILDGKAEINIQGRIYDVEKNSLVCIVPYQYTKIIKVEKPLVYSLVVFNFELFNELIKIHMNFYNEDINLIKLISVSNVVKCDDEKFEQVINIFEKLKDELGTESLNFQVKPKNNFTGVYVSSQILELISFFLRENKQKTKKELDSEENYSHIIQYIYMNLRQNITLKELSKIFFMSPSSISSYIMKMTGYNYSDLVFQMKIARIQNFLLYTDMTLDEISTFLRYADSSYVSKVFNSKADINISEYKKTYKKVNTICKIKESPVSYKVVDYIYNNYDLDLNIKDVSHKFGISALDVNYHLKFLVEKNFNCFLNYVRVNKSVQMLIDTDKPITEISKEVGYDNSRTYNRNFKKFYNTNPTDFRERVKNKN